MASTFGSFGDVADDVRRTEFYAFFHLIDHAREDQPDGSTIFRMGTVGAMFKDYMRFAVVIDPSGDTMRIALELDGEFIESRDLAPFAADIVRSFVRGGLRTEDDLTALTPLLRDLESRPVTDGKANALINDATLSPDDLAARLQAALDRGEQVAVNLGANEPAARDDLPAVATRGFAVFAGRRDQYATPLDATEFTMRNDASSGRRVLTVSFDRLG